jgi:hypothetical protein
MAASSFSSAGRDHIDTELREDHGEAMFNGRGINPCTAVLDDTEAYDMINGFCVVNNGLCLIRNARCNNVAGDQTQLVSNIYGLIVTNQLADWYRVATTAITITYTGASGTATYLRDWANGNQGDLILKENGAQVRRVMLSQQNRRTNKTMQDVVNDINAQAGWVATLLNNKQSSGGLTSAVDNFYTVAEVSAKGSVATLYQRDDVHGDITQSRTDATPHTNILFVNITGWDTDSQCLYFGDALNGYDIFVINCAFSTHGVVNQWNLGVFFHNTHIWHCAHDVGVVGFGSFDNTCSILNNVMRRPNQSGATNNSYRDGMTQELAGSPAFNATHQDIGVALSAIFASPSTGDFHLKAGNTLQSRPCAVDFDLYGNARVIGANLPIGPCSIQ